MVTQIVDFNNLLSASQSNNWTGIVPVMAFLDRSIFIREPESHMLLGISELMLFVCRLSVSNNGKRPNWTDMGPEKLFFHASNFSDATETD